MPYLSFENLAIGYENNVILDNLSFSIEKGDYVAIIGENGAGKSTLLKTMLGLIQPLSGKVILADGLKKSEIGYLPQQTLAQRDFPASVWEVVISGCLARNGLKPFYSKEDKALAKENIKKILQKPNDKVIIDSLAKVNLNRSVFVEQYNNGNYFVRVQYGIFNKFYPAVIRNLDVTLDIDVYYGGLTPIADWTENIRTYNHAAFDKFKEYVEPSYIETMQDD